VTAVPHRMRLICAVVAAVVVVVMLVVALFLRHESTGVVSFGSADQFAMAGIGLVLGAGILCLGRSKVDADAQGIRVQNVIGRYELPWAVVDAVRFERKSPWASLRLVTGEEMSVIAIQAVDGERAVAAVDGLRALLAAARAAAPRGPAGPPLLYGE
jgi:Bacterial PH domain